MVLRLHSAPSAPGEFPEELAADLPPPPPAHSRYLEACAAVLARVAVVDRRITLQERELITQLLQRLDRVPTSEAERIAAIAAGEARVGTAEGERSARILGRVATRAQRLALMRCAFGVARTDCGISPAALEHLYQIGRELGLRTDEIIACRHAAARAATRGE